MPNTEAGQDSAETVAASEYKKLQRKYDRRNESARKAEERIEVLESGVGRLEGLIEGLAQLIAADDDGLKTAAAGLVAKNASRRTADTTSAQLTARLNQLVEDADENWEDEKFDSARRALDAVNASGDLSRATEVERLIKEALKSPDTMSIEERIEAGVAAAMLKLQKDGARVDTGGTTAVTPKVRLADIANMNPREGIAAMRKRMDSVLDQLSK